MLVAPASPASPSRMDRPVRIGSAVDPGVLVLGILLDQRENVGDYLADVGLVAALFCAISLVVGYVVPKAAGVVEDQAIASSMEIGVHNGTLAIFVAVEVLDSTEISVPAAVYSLIMFVFAALWGTLVSRAATCGTPVSDLTSGVERRRQRGDLGAAPGPRWEIPSFSSEVSSAVVSSGGLARRRRTARRSRTRRSPASRG